MSLFKKLQDGDTRLKSLKFGNDRPKGGSSRQPYIKKGLVNDTLNPSLYNDFVLRGGILAPLSAAEDVARLTKYFTDLQNPNGILFSAKQNILSRTGTKTEASLSQPGYGGGVFNEGIYTPLSTIGQAFVGLTGVHLNKQGIDPTGLIPGLGIVTYQDAIKQNQFSRGSRFDFSDNRLTSLAGYSITDTFFPDISFNGVKDYQLLPNSSTLISYSGGAGSNVGFGKTNIKFATDNAGNVLKSILNPSSNTNVSNIDVTLTSKFATWDYKQFNTLSGLNLNSTTLNDFRENISTSKETESFLTSTPGYADSNNIESKFGLGNPGSRLRNRSDYKKGSLLPNEDISSPLDKINAYPIYKSESSLSKTGGSLYGPEGDPDLEDMIQFSIAILNNDDQNDILDENGRKTGKRNSFSFKKYMHFRSFIDSFSDSYDADWKSINYMGRGEKLYKYSGFDRKISMAFTVVAQSKNELNVMYNKLNFLASSLAPEYIDSLTSGYMAGNIAYINVGDYLSDQPGIITSLNYEIPEESPWEIERNNYSLRQLPHMIKVSLNFTPIHKFRPSKQSWANDWNKKGLGISTSTVIATPGNQKFIDPLSRYSPDKDINISLPTKPAQTIPSKGLAQQNIISNQIISDEVANTSIKLGNTLWNR
jgi:hypothetical protein